MKSWNRAFKDAVIVGTVAGLTSLVAMALRSHAENGTAWASVNAPSHWVWGDEAIAQDQPSWRYTATGFLIHQASAGFWGLVHEKVFASQGAPRPTSQLVCDAAVTSALAAWVDFRLVPHRLSPGFQHRLSLLSLTAVYLLFGTGLVAARYLLHRCSRHDVRPTASE
jgi:hypothetical protein